MIARSGVAYLRARCDGSAMVRTTNPVPAEAPHVAPADCSGAPPCAGAGAAAADLGSRALISDEAVIARASLAARRRTGNATLIVSRSRDGKLAVHTGPIGRWLAGPFDTADAAADYLDGLR